MIAKHIKQSSTKLSAKDLKNTTMGGEQGEMKGTNSSCNEQ